MTETSGRLLQLLSLLQARRDWPGAELADRLGVSGRTIRRDVERLRQLGYPVDSLTGPAGGYRLRAGSAMPPLLLDDEEAIAIAVGLRTAARASVTGIEETAVRALVKLEQVLPKHLRRRVQALGSATVSPPVGGPTVDPQHLSVIAAACRDTERLRFAYTKPRWHRQPPRGRAARRREPRPALVPPCVGPPARGLALLPHRPPGAARLDRGALHGPHAPGQGRRRVREGEHHRGAEPLRGTRDAASRRGRDRRAASRPTGARSSRSTRTPASTAPATTTSAGWRCASRCSACDFEVHEPPELVEHLRRAGRAARARRQSRWQPVAIVISSSEM